MAILAVLALSPSVPFAHSPISWPALKLSVAKSASAAVDGIERRIERDDDDAGVARLLDRRHDRGRIARHQQDALGAGGDQLLDRRDFAVVVAVELAGVGLRRQAEFLGLGLEAFLHLDEERIGVGLGDEADDRPVGVGRRAGQRERYRRGGGGCRRCRRFWTLNSSQDRVGDAVPGHGREALSASLEPPCVVGRYRARISGACQG